MKSGRRVVGSSRARESYLLVALTHCLWNKLVDYSEGCLEKLQRSGISCSNPLLPIHASELGYVISLGGVMLLCGLKKL